MLNDNKLIIGLCDDEEYVFDSVKSVLESYGKNNGLNVELIYYSSARMLLEKKDRLDILLLDIEMPDMDGIEAGMKLLDWDVNYRIIMLTAREDRFRDAFKIGAFRFVSKPINSEDLFLAIDDAVEAMDFNNKVSVYRDNMSFDILQKDILYIEANHSSSLIYTGGSDYRSERSLKEWMAILNDKIFFQCHKSYIVNMSKIEKIDGDTIHLVTGDRIVVSRRLKKAFINAFMIYDTRWR